MRAAEELLHSASAQIGVATANMLPNITIGANAGYMNTVLAGLLAPQKCSGLGRQCHANGVRRRHCCCTELRGPRTTYKAAAWSYRGTVIGAVQNVADALRAMQNDADALKAARDFERAAKISLDLAQQQMQTGNANILICSPPSRRICRPKFRWCRHARRVSPTRPPCSKRSAAAGGIAPHPRQRRPLMWAQARPSRSSIDARAYSKYFSRPSPTSTSVARTRFSYRLLGFFTLERGIEAAHRAKTSVRKFK